MSVEKNEKKFSTPNGVVVKAAPNELIPQRRRVQLSFDPSTSLTEQSHKKDCDINHIVRTYARDEILALRNDRPELYGDFASAPEYMQALNLVTAATQQFDALPSEIRKEFDNSPQRFLEFVENPKNGKRVVELGLGKERPKSDPPASRSDIEKLTQAVEKSAAPKKAPKDE